MYAQVSNSRENKSREVGSNVGQKKSNGKQYFGFVDNRQGFFEQGKLKNKISPIANNRSINSSSALQLRKDANPENLNWQQIKASHSSRPIQRNLNLDMVDSKNVSNAIDILDAHPVLSEIEDDPSFTLNIYDEVKNPVDSGAVLGSENGVTVYRSGAQTTVVINIAGCNAKNVDIYRVIQHELVLHVLPGYEKSKKTAYASMPPVKEDIDHLVVLGQASYPRTRDYRDSQVATMQRFIRKNDMDGLKKFLLASIAEINKHLQFKEIHTLVATERGKGDGMNAEVLAIVGRTATLEELAINAKNALRERMRQLISFEAFKAPEGQQSKDLALHMGSGSTFAPTLDLEEYDPVEIARLKSLEDNKEKARLMKLYQGKSFVPGVFDKIEDLDTHLSTTHPVEYAKHSAILLTTPKVVAVLNGLNPLNTVPVCKDALYSTIIEKVAGVKKMRMIKNLAKQSEYQLMHS